MPLKFTELQEQSKKTGSEESSGGMETGFEIKKLKIEMLWLKAVSPFQQPWG
jgi:hypothetical protein